MFDIVIPCAPKDYGTLRLCLRQIRRHLRGWAHIYVISPPPAIGLGNRAYWVQEPSSQSIENYYKQKHSPHMDRVGWLHQTLIKLEARKHIPDNVPPLAKHYVCIDADVLFLRPVTFFGSEQWFEYHQWSLYPPYKDVFERLTGIVYPAGHGFVMHHMAYRQERVDELVEHIKRHTRAKTLQWAVLKTINVCDQSPFAECDTFGAWMMATHPEEIRHRHLRILEKSFIPHDVWMAVHENTEFDLVACHAYMRQPS